MKVLTLTTLFPNHRFPLHGLFVKARMEEVAKLCEVEVVAPVPFFPPLRVSERYYNYSQVVREEWMGGMRVYHPRFFLLPKVGKGLDGLLLFLSIYPAVKKLYRRFPFDLLDVHFAYPDGYAGYLLARALKKPYTVTIRGSDVNLFPQYPVRRQLIRRALSNANRVIAVCQALKDAAVALDVPADHIVVVPNGVDLTRFFPVNKQEARRTVNLPPERRIILSVGHLCERKGFHLLIEAMPTLLQKVGHDLLLVIVGGNVFEGDFLTFLKNKVAELRLDDHVLLVGPKSPEELRFWYSAADLFCLASSREGWPNVCFESLACGVPVVATNIWGTPEVICSPDYGLLVDERTPKALAAGIERGLQTTWDARKMIDYARQHTWANVARQVLSVFESVCQTTNEPMSQ
ncbi:MAG: glycosyltransferase family 4 protein [Abditibacteriales bacterium]|nr:glycosyltransferase family 4 protein [Abditibacteriales bacterium]MDW8366104.1 glycosyltransferase family 4 protein [Abditibacteriales bacterium]